MVFQAELIKSLQDNISRIAIEYGDKQISYRQLQQASFKLASYLKQRESQDELACIGIVSSDRVHVIISCIGIALSRNIFIPLDISQPSSRIEKQISTAGIQCVLASRNMEKLDSFSHVEKIYLEDVLGMADVPEVDVWPSYLEEDSLYVYFTSGTTGEPKGIVGKNISLLQFLRWEIKEFSIREDFRFSQFISPYFDAFLRDVFVPLLAGGTVCIPEDPSILEPERLMRWLDDHEITVVHCVPSVFRIFNSPTLTFEHYKSLRYVLLSGERLIPAELKNWFQVFGNRIELVNFYGSTETTMIRTFYRIKDSDVEKNRIPVGKPIEGTEVFILNERLKPCPALMAGRIFIVSDFCTKGYLQNDPLNAEKFIQVPTLDGTLVTAFDTGDKGRKLADGNIDLLGRDDRQIKLRGIRVELVEIEKVFFDSGLVRNILVIPLEEEVGNMTLFAFIIPLHQEKNGALLKKMQDYATKYLPDYMRPSNIYFMEEFPLLPNGKVDIKKLEAIPGSKSVDMVEPTNETEAQLLVIWKSILKKDELSIKDNFLQIGGNSISLMKLIAIIYKEFGVRFALSDVFKNLTVQGQAEKIRSLQQSLLYKIPKAENAVRFPLTRNQERMLFQHELDKNDLSYNLPVAWTIKNFVSVHKLSSIFQRLIARHEAFRTKFIYEDNQFWQLITETSDFEIERIRIIGGESALRDAIRHFIRPFNLSEGSLLRVALFEADETFLLVLDTHHIICDGMSQVNLIRDFLAYSAEQELTPLDIQFKDYAVWERNFRESKEYRENQLFWQEMLHDLPPNLQFPTEIKHSADTSASSYEFQLSRQKIESIVSCFQDDNVTVFSILYALYYLFLSRLTSARDIVIGINSTGRVQQEVFNLIGMFAKTLPVRYRLQEGNTFKEFVLQAHKLLTEVNDKQLYDLLDIKDSLIKDGMVSKNEELFNTMLIFQNLDFSGLFLEDNSFMPYELETVHSKFALSLFVFEESNSFRFRFEYKNAWFCMDDMLSMQEQIQELLDRIALDTHQRVRYYLNVEDEKMNLMSDSLDEEISFNI